MAKWRPLKRDGHLLVVAKAKDIGGGVGGLVAFLKIKKTLQIGVTWGPQ